MDRYVKDPNSMVQSGFWIGIISLAVAGLMLIYY